MPETVHFKAKVCLVGDKDVDKTGLIRRFVQDMFDDRFITTLGTKLSKKEVQVPVPERGLLVIVDMNIWDIMGQKGFREPFKEAYFYGAKGILAVCDSTRKKTLEDLDDLIEGVYQTVGRIPVVFVANNSDDIDALQMTEADMEAASSAYGGTYFFASSKTGQNVETAFMKLAEKIVAAEWNPSRT